MTPPATAQGVPAPAPRPRRILYADDVPQLQRLLQIALGRDGHMVETVANGREALERITATPETYDLLITDHHMPVMNGLELVGRARAQLFPGRIIVFSSELSQEVADAYRRLQVDHLLPKPIFPQTLRAILATLWSGETGQEKSRPADRSGIE
jgi:two-component system chemotaxis response regulator CheY